MGAAFGVAVAMAVAVLAILGTDARAIRVALELTARWSFLLFWVAYVGGATASLFGPAFKPLAQRGREFGLAFAAAHLVHLGLVFWLYWISARPPLSSRLFVFFAIGIVWTYLLAALSFRALSQALGPTLWRVLFVVGLNYILIAFAYDFVLTPLRSGIMHQRFWHAVEYMPFAAMCVVAPVLRYSAVAHRRWRGPVVVSQG